MSTAMLDHHMLVERALPKVGQQPSGPQRRDSPPSATSTATSSYTDFIPSTDVDRSPSGLSVTFREPTEALSIRRTRSNSSSNGGGSVATPVSRGRSQRSSSTPSQRRASKTW